MAHQPGRDVDGNNHTRDPQQQRLIDHQELAAKIFPWGQTEACGEKAAGEPVDPPVGEAQEMIHSAASQGASSSVRTLITDGGVHPDAQDRFGRTALHWAAGQGHLETVVALLNSGASIEARSGCNASPLMLAASEGHDNVACCLLFAGASASVRHCYDPSYPMGWTTTALHHAARGGHLRVVTTLLNAGFRTDQRNEGGLTPAELSARSCYASSPAVTNLLLGGDRGGKLVYKYVDMAMEDVEIVRGLALAGAFLDWQDQQHGRTPLHRAVHFRHFQILKILLQAGANPNLPDRYGMTPLHLVAISGCTAGMAGLLSAGADTTVRTHDSYPPLHLAVAFKRVGVARLLIRAQGYPTELRDFHLGITPLSWASKIGYSPMVCVLLEAGADVESRSAGDLTPLHWACRSNNAEIVQLLIDAGADLAAVDCTGADAGSVVGLGDPIGCTVPQGSPFMNVMALNEEERHMDPTATERIQLALEIGKKERTWRRRGWLVVLARRRALATASKQPVLSTGSSSLTTGLVAGWTGIGDGGDGALNWQLVGQLKDDDKNGVNHDPYHGSTGDYSNIRGPYAEYKTVRFDALMSSPYESRQGINGGSSQGSGSLRPPGSVTSGVAGRFEDRAGPFLGSVAVEALLGLAAVEAGVFRNVIRFI